jgi:hypothetical protein
VKGCSINPRPWSSRHTVDLLGPVRPRVKPSPRGFAAASPSHHLDCVSYSGCSITFLALYSDRRDQMTETNVELLTGSLNIVVITIDSLDCSFTPGYFIACPPIVVALHERTTRALELLIRPRPSGILQLHQRSPALIPQASNTTSPMLTMCIVEDSSFAFQTSVHILLLVDSTTFSW